MAAPDTSPRRRSWLTRAAAVAAVAFAGRGADSGDVAVICRNTTEAINQLACRLGLSGGDVVATTVAEHYSNRLPWARAATCRYVECDEDGTFAAEDVAAALDQRPGPRLLAITGAAAGALESIGWAAVTGHERRIARLLRRGLAAIPGVRLLGPGPGTETLPVATFTIDGIPAALVAARLAEEEAIGVRHGCFYAQPYLNRLLGLSPAQARASRDRARGGGMTAMPGAVRASAGISTSERDVARLLAAVGRLVTAEPPVRYRRDPSTADFYPVPHRARAGVAGA